MYQDTCVGCRYTDDGADYLQLSFLPSDRAADNVSQARAAFENIAGTSCWKPGWTLNMLPGRGSLQTTLCHGTIS